MKLILELDQGEKRGLDKKWMTLERTISLQGKSDQQRSLLDGNKTDLKHNNLTFQDLIDLGESNDLLRLSEVILFESSNHSLVCSAVHFVDFSRRYLAGTLALTIRGIWMNQVVC